MHDRPGGRLDWAPCLGLEEVESKKKVDHAAWEEVHRALQRKCKRERHGSPWTCSQKKRGTVSTTED